MGVFNRLGYNFDSTKFGDGDSFTVGQAQVLNSTPAISTWQAADLINVAVTGYYQNPHSANLAILTTLVNNLSANSNTSTITFTNASWSANNLKANANTLLSEITSFTDHTNRISGVTQSSNVASLPDYQTAMTIGRQVLTITNQIDGVQNNAPLLGNFTSLAIGSDISNTITILTRDLATLNASITVANSTSNISSATMNTIVSDVQAAYNLLNTRRVSDTNFYLNSLYLVNDYNKVSQFNTVGVNSKYLINTLNIGTDKLKTNLQTSTVVPRIVNSGTTTTTTPTSSSSAISSAGLSPTGVTPGLYTNSIISVDAYGRVTSAADGFSPSSPVANTQITGLITSPQIASVSNTQITGLITSPQIANVSNTQITGTIAPTQLTSGVNVQTQFKSWTDPTVSTTTYTYVTTTNGTLSITSKLANSKFLVHFFGQGYLNATSGANIGLSRTIGGSTTRLVGVDGGSGDTWMGAGNGAGTNSWAIGKNYLDSPAQPAGTVITYNLLLGLWSAGTVYLNYTLYGGYATITITEIAP